MDGDDLRRAIKELIDILEKYVAMVPHIPETVSRFWWNFVNWIVYNWPSSSLVDIINSEIKKFTSFFFSSYTHKCWLYTDEWGNFSFLRLTVVVFVILLAYVIFKLNEEKVLNDYSFYLIFFFVLLTFEAPEGFSLKNLILFILEAIEVQLDNLWYFVLDPTIPWQIKFFYFVKVFIISLLLWWWWGGGKK